MEKVTIERYVQLLDALKRKSVRIIFNNFMHTAELAALFEEKSCYVYAYDASFFLLIPYHNTYYEVVYFSVDAQTLSQDLQALCSEYPQSKPFRLSVVEKMLHSSGVVEAAKAAGFATVKVLERREAGEGDAKKKAAMAAFLADVSTEKIEFATHKDAPAILALLQEEFDLYADNIPELAALEKSISKNEIIIARDGDKIIFTHIFENKNNLIKGFYDVVAKGYRDTGIFYSFLKFASDNEMDLQYVRFYDWRDINNKKLTKSASFDPKKGLRLYLTNMKRVFPHKESSNA